MDNSTPGGITNPDHKNRSSLSTLRTFLPYMWPHNRVDLKRMVVIAMTLLIGSRIINIFVPITYKLAVESLSNQFDIKDQILFVPVLLIVSYGLIRISAQIFGEIKDALFSKVTQHAVRNLALETFNQVHGLSLRFHLNRKMGGLNTHISKGVSSIETLLRFTLFNIIPTFLEIILVSIILWKIYQPCYAIVTLSTLIVYIIFTIRYTEWRTILVRKMNKIESDANATMLDSFMNYETVKFYGNEQHEARRYEQHLDQYQRAAVDSAKSLSILNISQGIIISIGLVTIMIMAAYGVKDGRMTVGDFVLVNTYLIQLYLPLNILGFAYREIKLSLINMENMFTILQRPQEVSDISEARELVVAGGCIEFKNVSFSYDPDRVIFSDLNFKVPAGTTTAIVGASGAGKSTISRLLFRFYDITAGQILIDDQDIRSITQQSLRATIGMVPQDTILFNETVFYNIAYGNPMASYQAVIEAAKQAKIHDFIVSLPDNYNTVVGERGLKLSGGEKQRIAIARTLLKQAKILIFDEATSALDSHTEKMIQTSLDEISVNRTTIIIAHRLSTIIGADEILVFDQGKVCERGTHNNLLTQQGLYHAMWLKQHQDSSD